MKYLIYALADPGSGEIRYVGRSSSSLERPKAHWHATKAQAPTHTGNWVRSLRAAGTMYEIRVLEVLSAADGVPGAERAWIAKLRAEGARLTNHTDGGEGCVGRVVSAETRAKLHKNIKHLHTPESRRKSSLSRIGKRPSEESIAKTAAKNRGRKRSAEFCRRLGDRSRGHKKSPETLAKMSAGRKGIKVSDAWRAAMSAALKGRVVSAAHRLALSAALKGHTVSAETRDKIRQSLLRRRSLAG